MRLSIVLILVYVKTRCIVLICCESRVTFLQSRTPAFFFFFLYRTIFVRDKVGSGAVRCAHQGLRLPYVEQDYLENTEKVHMEEKHEELRRIKY